MNFVYPAALFSTFSCRTLLLIAAAVALLLSSTLAEAAGPSISASASPSRIKAYSQKVTLSWNSPSADYCSVNGTRYPTSGSGPSGPYAPGNYSVRFSCTNSGGTTYRTLRWTAYVPRPSVSANILQSSVNVGQRATLRWSSSNSTSCNYGGTSGQTSIGPWSSPGWKSVTVTCSGAGGSRSDSESVYVNPPPTLNSFTLSKTTMYSNEIVVANWSSSGASACHLSSGGNLPANGPQTFAGSSLALGTSTATLYCTDSTGTSNSISRTITVNAWVDTDGDGTHNDHDSDDDNDGMPDSWENSNGLNRLVNDRNQDPDGDGDSNITEYNNGTDPKRHERAQLLNYDLVASTIFDNQGATVNWSSRYANACYVVGDSTNWGTSGPASTVAGHFSAGTYTVQFYCTGPGGSSGTQSQTLNVIAWVDTDGDGARDEEDPDDDNDGMPDSWENSNGLNRLVANAGGDADGDGDTNITEYQNGTNPQRHEVAQLLNYDLVASTIFDNQAATVNWSSEYASSCHVVGDSTDWGTNGPASTAPGQFSAGTHSFQFYCTGPGGNSPTLSQTLNVIAWVDTDGDGIRDEEDSDDDNDGMPDTWEIANGLNSLVANAGGDADGDGDTNKTEYQNGTDPQQHERAQLLNYDLVASTIFDNEIATVNWSSKYATACYVVGDSTNWGTSGPASTPVDHFPAGSYEVQFYCTGPGGDSPILGQTLNVIAWIDTDGDGIRDEEEPDDDNDGLPDDWEIASGLNSLVSDAGADPDGDGDNNTVEYNNGTDPQTHEVAQLIGYSLVDSEIWDFEAAKVNWSSKYATGCYIEGDTTQHNWGLNGPASVPEGHYPAGVHEYSFYCSGPGGASLSVRATLTVKSSTADSDGDDMPDYWEEQHSLNPNDPADRDLDPDGDLDTNITEFQNGTDPQVHEVAQLIDYQLDKETIHFMDEATVNWTSKYAEACYVVGDTETNWGLEGPASLPGDTFTPDTTLTVSFYCTGPGGDSAPQSVTLNVVSFFDVDEDGIDDQWEVAHGLDPTDPADAYFDLDGDGISNIDEFLEGTDPNFLDEIEIELSDSSNWEPGANPTIDVNTGFIPSSDVIIDSKEFLDDGMHRLVVSVASRSVKNAVVSSNVEFDATSGLRYTFTIPKGDISYVRFELLENGVIQDSHNITGLENQTEVTLDSEEVMGPDFILPLGKFTIIARFFSAIDEPLDTFALDLEVIRLVEFAATLDLPNMPPQSRFYYGEDIALTARLNGNGTLANTIESIEFHTDHHTVAESVTFKTFENTAPGEIPYRHTLNANDLGLPDGPIPVGEYTFHAKALAGSVVAYSASFSFEVVAQPETPITTYLDGFDFEYVAVSGDVDLDGDTDVVIRRIAEAGVEPGVGEFVLRWDGQSFVGDQLSELETSRANAFSVDNRIEIIVADFNIDGIPDALIKDLNAIHGTASNAFAFAPSQSGLAPSKVVNITPEVGNFYQHLGRFLIFRDYFSESNFTTSLRPRTKLIPNVLWHCSNFQPEDTEGWLASFPNEVFITTTEEDLAKAVAGLEAACALHNLRYRQHVDVYLTRMVEVPDSWGEQFGAITEGFVEALGFVLENGYFRGSDDALEIRNVLGPLLGVDIFGDRPLSSTPTEEEAETLLVSMILYHSAVEDDVENPDRKLPEVRVRMPIPLIELIRLILISLNQDLIDVDISPKEILTEEETEARVQEDDNSGFVIMDTGVMTTLTSEHAFGPSEANKKLGERVRLLPTTAWQEYLIGVFNYAEELVTWAAFTIDAGRVWDAVTHLDRAEEVMKTVIGIPDMPHPDFVAALTSPGSDGDEANRSIGRENDRIIFGTGVTLFSPTATADQSFIRSLRGNPDPWIRETEVIVICHKYGFSRRHLPPIINSPVAECVSP